MTQIDKLRRIVREMRAYSGMTGPSRSKYLRWADEIEETLTNRSTPSPASPARSDTREQAAASPSAVGEGQPVLAYCVLYRDGTEELTWPNKDGTRDENSDEWHGEPRSITPLSSQAPKTASAGGAEACLAATMVEGIDEAIANGDIERIRDIWNRRLGAIAAEADTAKEDAADVARYSADDFVAPPPSEWSPAGQRRLIEALEQHKSAPPNRLAPIEARGVVTDAMEDAAIAALNGVDLVKAGGWKGVMRIAIKAALRAHESAPAVETPPNSA